MKAKYEKERIIVEIGREEVLRLGKETMRCLYRTLEMDGIGELDSLLTDYRLFLKTQGVPS